MIVRELSLFAFILWQGGFLFYALVVVPIGTDELGAVSQGSVTRRVTVWLNNIGYAALFVAAFEVHLTRVAVPLRRGLLFVAFVQQMALSGLHIRLSEILDNGEPGFYQRHAFYLIISGTLWFTMMLHTIVMLRAWRAADRKD